MLTYEPPLPTNEHKAAVELLACSNRILLTGHERPDGDCIGSQAALCRILNARGQSAFVLNADEPDQRYREILTGDFHVDDGGELPEHDLVVMLDGGELSRTGRLAQRLSKAASKKLVVDHHLHDGDRWWDAAFVDTSASATGILVRRLAAHLGAPIDGTAARAIFTTLVTDTGWFKYSNTNTETLTIAAELLGLGVRPAEVYGDLFQRQGPDHPRSLSGALARSTYYAGGRLALVDLPEAQGGGPFEVDSDAVLDILRSVESVEVALVVRAVDAAHCKLSARSKGAFNVQQLAARFGGGGHAKAAGATIKSPIETARKDLVEAALELLTVTVERRAQPRTAADAARES